MVGAGACGISRLTIIGDADEVCVSNTNQQLHALDGEEFGRPAVLVMAQRAQTISPRSTSGTRSKAFVTPSNLEHMLGPRLISSSTAATRSA